MIIAMPEEDNKILKYNEGEESMKVPFIIYADLECLLEKMHTCDNNPEKSSTTKIIKHTPSGYSLFTHCSFDTTKNKLDYYSGKNCMKNLCLDLREHVTKIINYDKKDIVPLTKQKKRISILSKFVIYVKKDLVPTITIKNIIRLEIIVTILGNIEVLLMISAT